MADVFIFFPLLGGVGSTNQIRTNEAQGNILLDGLLPDLRCLLTNRLSFWLEDFMRDVFHH